MDVVDDVKGFLGVDISEDGSNSEELREADTVLCQGSVFRVGQSATLSQTVVGVNMRGSAQPS